MKKNIENGIYIPSGNRELHTIDEWMQQAHPENAQTVVLVTDFGMLEIAKEDLPGGFNFEGAQKAAAEYRKGFRCLEKTVKVTPKKRRKMTPKS